MEYRPLGHTGISVSKLCLGAMMFGSLGNADHEDCGRIVHRALEAGINFIDTADMYSGGESEQIVGEALKGRREHVVIATKFWFPGGADVNQRGGSRRWIVQAVEKSLQRLDTDYIDLYQIHRFDEATDLEEILFTLTELVRQGKIRTFGSSTFPADRIVEAQWVAQSKNLLRFRCEQPNYSILVRDIERFVLPACQRYGMGAIVWAPLDGGFLSGKYRGTEDFTEDSRVVRFGKYRPGGFDPEADAVRAKIEIAKRLIPIAEQAGLTVAQLAVAFTLVHPGVTSAIIGPRTLDHLETILPAADAKLSSEILDQIDALVPPGSTLSPFTDLPSGLDPARRRRVG